MGFLVFVGIILFIILFFFLKAKIWDPPRDEIRRLEQQLRERDKEAYKRDEVVAIRKQFQRQCDSAVESVRVEFLMKENAHRKELREVKDKCDKKIRDAQQNEAEMRANYEKIRSALKQFESNMTAIPYMAGIISDIETYGLEELILGLSWGRSQQRLDKVKSIREIRKDATAMVEKNKEAQYQLAYLLDLFPNLADVIECEFKSLPPIQVSELSDYTDYDSTRDYLSKEEYAELSVTERTQLALDRYISSHNKTKWQIGRDYEQYVGHKYREMGFEVDDYGSYMGLEDLGRDIIAQKDGHIWIIQCKYWSSIKLIHEKHITQLYGTTISYCIEHGIDPKTVTGILITNIQLSDMAKKMAAHLGIKYRENYEMGEYPRIKCNIGNSEFGKTKIYHLPFDQQYDVTKIKDKGECYAMTVAEAEAKGFRRTYKWFGNS